MQPHTRVRESGVERRRSISPEFAEQVENGAGPNNARVAEWKIAHRAHELLELARGAGDFGFMERVVRPRSELIHQQSIVAEQEQLHRHEALELKLESDVARDLFRLVEDV